MVDERAVCIWCPRTCPRCGYDIDGGWEHVEQPQSPESNVVVCSLRRGSLPLREAAESVIVHNRRHRLRLVKS